MRAARIVPWWARWCARHRRWLGLWLVAATGAWFAGHAVPAAQLVAVGLAPGLLAGAGASLWPTPYERLIGGPARRVGWWWFARRRWQATARVCGLSERQPARGLTMQRRTRAGHPVEVTEWVAPKLRRVRTSPQAVELTIRARPGQRLTDLEVGAERLATTFAAVAHRVWPAAGSRSGCTVVVQLVMRDVLTHPRVAAEPEPRAVAEAVTLGRTQSARPWRLQVRGRHTLVAGCSGAGKGSVLWGICCGLAPAVRADVARLWGIDLKRGVELAMGEPLFSTRAYTPADALRVLRALMRVIDARGARMAGATRLHAPTVGDPLHVLVIDELAALTAYADLEVRREANRLLAEILTQGRALGVVVVACVQDPRKDVVAMRGLFTQTVALRLRSSEETVMVLGEGMTHLAPAHRISPTHPGVGWVVDDAGAAERVRADYWPDGLIRQIAGRLASPVRISLDADDSATTETCWPTFEPQDPADASTTPSDASAGPRTARRPRRPRSPRSRQSRTGEHSSTPHNDAVVVRQGSVAGS